MKLDELKATEASVINALKERATLKGDNEAARVLLEHLRCVCEQIDHWKEKKERKEASPK